MSYWPKIDSVMKKVTAASQPIKGQQTSKNYKKIEKEVGMTHQKVHKQG